MDGLVVALVTYYDLSFTVFVNKQRCKPTFVLVLPAKVIIETVLVKCQKNIYLYKNNCHPNPDIWSKHITLRNDCSNYHCLKSQWDYKLGFSAGREFGSSGFTLGLCTVNH